MSFFSFRQKIYPLIALFAGAVVLVFGLIGAKTVIASYFLLGVLCWYLIFGYYKQVLRILPAAVFFGGIFAAIAYAASHDPQSALAMANRFGALFLAAADRIVPRQMNRNTANEKGLCRYALSLSLNVWRLMGTIPLVSTSPSFNTSSLAIWFHLSTFSFSAA